MILLVAGCAGPKQPVMPTQTAITSTHTPIPPTATASETPFPTRTSTVTRTATQISSTYTPVIEIEKATSMITPGVTLIPALSPSPIPGVYQQCSILTEDTIPTEMALSGTVALVNTRRKIAESYILNLETGEKTGLPDETMQVFNNGAVSPDLKWFAYMGNEDTSEGGLRARNLVLIHSDGTLEKKD